MSQARENIVQAALQLFAGRGFDGVALRDIAKASGHKLGSIYYLFPEKRDLYRAVIAICFEHCTGRFIDALSGDQEPVEKIRNLVGLIFEMFVADDPHIRIIDMVHLNVESHELAETMGGMFTRMHAALDPVVAALGAQAESRPPPAWLASYVFSTAFGAAKLHRQHQPLLALDTPGQSDRFFDGLMDFMLRGLSPSSQTETAPRQQG